MNANSSSQQPKAEPKWQALSSLPLGVISIILASTCGIWIPMLLISTLLAPVGLFFGARGLKSKGKWRYLAVAGIVVCFLALVASFYLLFAGGLYYIFTY
jgi:hypothetical protein